MSVFDFLMKYSGKIMFEPGRIILLLPTPGEQEPLYVAFEITGTPTDTQILNEYLQPTIDALERKISK